MTEADKSENQFDAQLETLKEKSVDRLLNADAFDVAAFDELRSHLWRKAEGLRAETSISKQILTVLRSAAGAIRSRAEYLAEVRDQVSLADDFDLMLDQLIAGETRPSRETGVPRAT